MLSNQKENVTGLRECTCEETVTCWGNRRYWTAWLNVSSNRDAIMFWSTCGENTFASIQDITKDTDLLDRTAMAHTLTYTVSQYKGQGIKLFDVSMKSIKRIKSLRETSAYTFAHSEMN